MLPSDLEADTRSRELPFPVLPAEEMRAAVSHAQWQMSRHSAALQPPGLMDWKKDVSSPFQPME
jgi:hypothetical protein